MKIHFFRGAKFAGLFVIGVTGILISSLYAEDCATELPAANQFERTTLVDIAQSGNGYDLDVAADGRIFFVERHGELRVHNQQTDETSLIAEMDVNWGGEWGGVPGWGKNEGGLSGIALDKNFLDNSYIYLFYSVPPSELNINVNQGEFGPIERVSRFTLTNDGTDIDLASEKVILEMPWRQHCCHHGGDIYMAKGNVLWISTGDNKNPGVTNGNPRSDNPVDDVRESAGNSFDYRGKILRVAIRDMDETHERMDWGVGKSYDIPPGNLLDKYRDMYTAAEQAKFLPEIYTMGHRNPFTIAVYERQGWVGAGEASGAAGWDEVNMSPGPNFMGWPYFSGKNVPYNNPDVDGLTATNNSPNNTGVTTLPPAYGSIYDEEDIGSRGFCYGETYGFINIDSTRHSPDGAFPPYMDRAMYGNGAGRSMHLFTFNDDGTVADRQDNHLASIPGTPFRGLHAHYDGNLYVISGVFDFADNVRTQIFKVSYTGDCKIDETNIVATKYYEYTNLKEFSEKYGTIMNSGVHAQVAIPDGALAIKAYNIKGELVWDYNRQTSEGVEYKTIPAHVETGVLQFQFLDGI